MIQGENEELDQQQQWVRCPYNANHKMPQSRLQWHLLKCQDKKRNGFLYSTCPFNAIHQVLKTELSNHIAKCPDKKMTSSEEPEIDKEIQEYLSRKTGKRNENFEKKATWEPGPSLPIGYEPVSQPQNTNRPKKTKRNSNNRNKNTYTDNNDQIPPPDPLNHANHPSNSSTISEGNGAKSVAPSENKIRALTKKIRQIEELEKKQCEGQTLDEQQLMKLKTKGDLLMELDALKQSPPL